MEQIPIKYLNSTILRVFTVVIEEQAQLDEYIQSCIIAEKSTLTFKSFS